ncbi:MAG: alpha/beta fold hydrolase [Chloroflexota bacterium]
MQPIYEFGGAGPVVHLAVANGFPPQTYHPLVEPLTARYRVVNLPPRALWPDARPPEQRQNWKQTVAADLIQGLRDYDLRDVIAIGHSFGGVASILAAIAEPERFRALVLLDPTILPRAGMWSMRLSQWLGRDLVNPLARGADRRRDRFESCEAAYERLRGKALFADWDERAFQGYIDALRTLPDGAGVTLAWPRAWEAYYFRTLYTYTWNELPRLRALVPVLTIRGGDSDTLLPTAAARMRRVLPEMTYREVAGHGHLFPQSAPDVTRAMIAEWLDALD